MLPSVVMTLLLPSVAESIVVAGGDVSTVQLNNTGVVLILPTLSCAMTMNVWDPSNMLAGVNCTGLVHVANEAPSNEHSR